VWDSAFVLVDYLSRSMQTQVQRKVIMELGSGTGLAGCAIGLLGCRRLILTDVEVCDLHVWCLLAHNWLTTVLLMMHPCVRIIRESSLSLTRISG
jgi:hypothetical protein